jgi:hypothetical protein
LSRVACTAASPIPLRTAASRPPPRARHTKSPNASFFIFLRCGWGPSVLYDGRWCRCSVLLLARSDAAAVSPADDACGHGSGAALIAATHSIARTRRGRGTTAGPQQRCNCRPRSTTAPSSAAPTAPATRAHARLRFQQPMVQCNAFIFAACRCDSTDVPSARPLSRSGPFCTLALAAIFRCLRDGRSSRRCCSGARSRRGRACFARSIAFRFCFCFCFFCFLLSPASFDLERCIATAAAAADDDDDGTAAQRRGTL